MMDALRKLMNFRVQIGCDRGHQLVEPASPLGFLNSLDMSPQRVFDVENIGQNVLGDQDFDRS